MNAKSFCSLLITQAHISLINSVPSLLLRVNLTTETWSEANKLIKQTYEHHHHFIYFLPYNYNNMFSRPTDRELFEYYNFD